MKLIVASMTTTARAVRQTMMTTRERDDDDEEDLVDADGAADIWSQAVDRIVASIMARSFGEAPPPTARGLPPSLLGALSVRTHDSADHGQGACAVCLEDFVDGDSLRPLPCAHAYHVACIDRWLADHDACPCCRAPAFDRADPRAVDLAAADPAAASFLGAGTGVGVGALSVPVGPVVAVEPGPMPSWLHDALSLGAS